MYEYFAGALNMSTEQLDVIIKLLSLVATGIFGVITWRQRLEKQQSEVRLKKAETELETVQGNFSLMKQSLTLISESVQSHAASDAENAKNASRSIDVQDRLAEAINAIRSSNEAIAREQKNAAMQHDTRLNAISASTAALANSSESTLSKIDLLGGQVGKVQQTSESVLTALTDGLKQIKGSLDDILNEAKRNPNKDALERIEKDIASLLTIAKPLSDAIARDAKTQPLPPLEEPTPANVVDLPIETNEEKKDIPA